jgi:Protein of unknwon function (DUF3310)
MMDKMTKEREEFRRLHLVDVFGDYSFKEIGEALDVIGFEAFHPRPDQVAYAEAGDFDGGASQMEMFQLQRLHDKTQEAVKANVEQGLRDMVVLPEHYARYKIEPIRFIVENYGPGFLIGNIIKYVMRYDAKNGAEDIKKAQRYGVMLQRFEANDPDWWRAES